MTTAALLCAMPVRGGSALLLALALPASLVAQTWNVTDVASLDTANEHMASGDTIVIAAGTYLLDRTVQMNTAQTTIEGATGNPADVVLQGGGMNTHGVDEAITVGASNVTIQGLTVTQCYYNGVHTRAEDNVQNVLIQHLITKDCGERHIKGSASTTQTLLSGGIVIQDVTMIQDMERQGHPDTDPDYIGGIDMMSLSSPIIQRVTAIGIHGTNDGGRAAIFLWNGIENPTVVDNHIIGCAKGIALGNPAAPGPLCATGAYHAIGGLVANNTVLRGTWETGDNIGLELVSTKDVLVADNTIYSDDATYFRTVSISDAQPAVGLTTGLALSGNLVRGALDDFTGGTGWSQAGDLIDASGTTVVAAWFVDPDAGDFHLTTAATGAIGAGTPLSGVPTDADGTTRRSPGDIGAYQDTFGSGSGTSTATGGAGTGTATGGTGTATAGSATSGSTLATGGGSGGGGGCGLGAGAAMLLALAATLRHGARRHGRSGMWLLVAVLLLCPRALPAATPDAQEANHDDQAWLSAWISHCQGIYTTHGKTAGMVLEIGDSITHANPYGQWARYGAGWTSSDQATITWMHATVAFSGSANDTANPNGFYLSAADTNGNRGMTCSSGITTGEILSGDGNGGTAMPALTDPSAAAQAVADGVTYTNNLNVTTVAAAFPAAQFAVLMLGTNDARANVPVGTFSTNLASIVQILEAQHIVVVLSTIPPNEDTSTDTLCQSYGAAIASYAQSHGLPLIDYRAEILLRQPGTAWIGTLINANDVHPTAGVNSYTAASDPYTPGGDPGTLTTGDACLNSGYLLRTWLTVQKLGEVYAGVVAGTLTSGTGSTTGTGTGTSATGGTGTATAGSATSASGGAGVVSTAGSSGGGCGLGAAGTGVLLAACVVRRRRGRP